MRLINGPGMWLLFFLVAAAPTPAVNVAGVWIPSPPNTGSWVGAMAGEQSRTRTSNPFLLCFSPSQSSTLGGSCLIRRGRASCPSRPPITARPTGTPRETLLPCASADTDAYSVLGVRPKSSPAEIKAAFRRSPPHHPCSGRRRPPPGVGARQGVGGAHPLHLAAPPPSSWCKGARGTTGHNSQSAQHANMPLLRTLCRKSRKLYPHTPHPTPHTLHPKHETRNLKHETRNPSPLSPKP